MRLWREFRYWRPPCWHWPPAARQPESIFDAVNRQLSMQGYMARGGQMIDASIVQTPKQSINKEEKSIVAENAMPADWSPSKRRQKDVDARWTKWNGRLPPEVKR